MPSKLHFPETLKPQMRFFDQRRDRHGADRRHYHCCHDLARSLMLNMAFARHADRIGEWQKMDDDQKVAEQTYRAIGRFMFEFSQVEYAVRYYLAQEVELKTEFFSPIIESYDVGMLTTVAREVFKQTRDETNSEIIGKLLNEFRDLNEHRKRVAHGLWVPFMKGGTVHYVSRSKLASSSYTEQAQQLEKLADDLSRLRTDLEREFSAITPALVKALLQRP